MILKAVSIVLLLVVVVLFLQPAESSFEPAEGEQTAFMRFVPIGTDAGRLETAIAEYRRSDGVEITLYSAVHVGEPAYYDALQEKFERHESLLYELVAEKGSKPVSGGLRAGGVIGTIQNFMEIGLGLEFQLDGVDYSPSNFVHADMDPETFARRQEAKGESFTTIFLNSMLAGMKQALSGEGSQANTYTILAAMAQPDSKRRLKLLFAKEMQNVEQMIATFGGGDGESVILTERNLACLAVLDEEIERGIKNIGVFYGGAHLPDMEVRLYDRGFSRTEVEYVVAWNIPEEGAGSITGGERSSVDDALRLATRAIERGDFVSAEDSYLQALTALGSEIDPDRSIVRVEIRQQLSKMFESRQNFVLAYAHSALAKLEMTRAVIGGGLESDALKPLSDRSSTLRGKLEPGPTDARIRVDIPERVNWDEGGITLFVDVGIDGLVTSARLLSDASGESERLRERAKRLRYLPATDSNGIPVSSFEMVDIRLD